MDDGTWMMEGCAPLHFDTGKPLNQTGNIFEVDQSA